jgi:hypothetical protein
MERYPVPDTSGGNVGISGDSDVMLTRSGTSKPGSVAGCGRDAVSNKPPRGHVHGYDDSMRLEGDDESS